MFLPTSRYLQLTIILVTDVQDCVGAPQLIALCSHPIASGVTTPGQLRALPELPLLSARVGQGADSCKIT